MSEETEPQRRGLVCPGSHDCQSVRTAQAGRALRWQMQEGACPWGPGGVWAPVDNLIYPLKLRVERALEPPSPR